MNNKGYSPSMAWVFGLVTLFGLGILYVVFLQVFVAYLVPTIKAQAVAVITNATDLATVNDGIDNYMRYFQMLPYILFGVVVIYLIAAAIRKERDSEFA